MFKKKVQFKEESNISTKRGKEVDKLLHLLDRKAVKVGTLKKQLAKCAHKVPN